MAKLVVPVRLDDLRGATRLATDATRAVTDLVEAVHHGISRTVRGGRIDPELRTGGIAGFVYGSVRGVTGFVESALALALRALPSNLPTERTPARDAVVAALNGVVGDHLAASDNPLAIAMRFRVAGRDLDLDRAALAASLPDARPRILVLVHGLCMDDGGWLRNGHDHGVALARELGMTPVYVRYNSGLSIARNGRELASKLETLAHHWPVPVESIAIVTHSMGGLVSRAACAHAEVESHEWRGRLTHLAFLGTPHHGAALERGGHGIDLLLEGTALTAPFARLGKLRSRGITDLRHGNVIDLVAPASPELLTAVPLPAGVACHALAASTGKSRGSLGERLFGDGLVSIDSALGRHPSPRRELGFAPARTWIGRGMNHMDLLNHAEVFEQLRERLSG